MRFGVVSATALTILLCGCEAAESMHQPPADTHGSATDRSVVATLDGVEIELAELEEFVARARFPGYRPATEREARRLLFALLRERVLDREAARRGLDPSSLLASLGSPGEGRRIVLDRLLSRADVRFAAGALAPLIASEPGGALPPGHAGGPS